MSVHEDYTYDSGYWHVRPAHVIIGGFFAFLVLLIGGVSLYDHGHAGGVGDATNYIAAKCDQKNEFRVHTSLSTFFFKCIRVKDVAVTPWDNVDISKPLEN